MRQEKFLVSGTDWEYSEPMLFIDAEERAKTESEKDGGSIRFLCNLYNRILYVYYDGKRYIPSDGRNCLQCDTQLSVEQANYSYEMTGTFFCSSQCGVSLGALFPNT